MPSKSFSSPQFIKKGQHFRPTSFDRFPGQHLIKQNLQVYVGASQKREQPLDHIILHGPPGLGKTTLARIVANELAVPFVQTSAPAIDKTGDLAGILTGLEPNTVIFIDEIHRLNIAIEEVLYSAMEDFAVDILVGQGPGSRSIRMEVEPFTLIGATTRLAKLSSPLVSRFGIQLHMEFYQPEDLALILKQSATYLKVNLEDSAAIAIAKRSRGTPRIANRLLRRIRDFSEFEDLSVIEAKFAQKVLDHLQIDYLGLDKMDRTILDIILKRYDGGPVGIEALASTIGEDRTTLEDVYEPFLVHQGLIERTPRGRVVTELARKHLNGIN